MSLKDRLNLVLGGEDGNPDVVLVTPEEHAIVLADGDIATADVAVAEAQQEINQNTVDIEQLEERVEDLESDVAGLEAMINGDAPWNPELAKEKYERARKITIRTFGEDDAISVKGAEAFGDASTAQMELLSGLEDMKEKSKGIWAGIQQFFVNLYNSVIAFFTGIFNSLRGLEKKADAIVTKLNGLADDKIKDTIKLGSWNAFLEVDKGGNTGDLKSFSATLNTISKGLDAQTTDGLVSALESSSSTLYSSLKDKKQTQQNENSVTTSAYIGGVHFTITLPKPSAPDKVAALRSSTISFKVTKEGVKTDGEFKSGLGKSQLIALAKKTKEYAANARIAKFDQSALKNSRDKAVAKAKAFGGKPEDTKKEVAGIRAGNQAALKFATTLTSFQTKAIAATQSYIGAHY